MNDNRKSKARHGRHAAPGKFENDSTSARDQSPASENESPSNAPPSTASSDADRQVAQADALPTLSSDSTAVMPQPVRPAAPYGGVGGIKSGIPAYASGGPMLPVDVSDADFQKEHKALKVCGIVVGILIALLAVVYLAGAVVFMDRFLPRTSVGDLDVSFKSSAEVRSLLTDLVDDYTLNVGGQGFSLTLSAKDAGMKLDGTSVTDAMHAAVNPWTWPLEIWRSHDEADKLAASYNESGLGDTVRAAVDQFNKTAKAPVNATVAYQAAGKSFAVQPESAGTALNYEAVIKAVDNAVLSMQPTLKLTADELAQPSVLSTDAKLKTAADQANTMIKSDLVLTMAGTTVGEVGPDLVSQWIKLGDDLSATLDEAALTAWVDKMVGECNTVGTQRSYTRADGKAVTVTGGVYGWEVDRDTLLGIVKDSVAGGKVATMDVPTVTTGTAYQGVGKRDWGARYCDIDLSEQYVRFYDDAGAVVWESPCISGEPNGQHDTPTGVYWLNQKASPSKLIGYENGKKIYESTVQYWMPFVNNVIGLHDADWQPGFGGTMYANGYGSHGCVNLPPGKAAELYGIIQSGDVVVCHW